MPEGASTARGRHARGQKSRCSEQCDTARASPRCAGSHCVSGPQEEEVLAEKRKRIEERLWAIHEADIGDFFERYDKEVTDKNGNIETDEKGAVLRQACERPKLLAALSPEKAKLIEDVTVDGKGRLIPKLYSKLQANKELRAFLNLSAKSEAPNVTKLSDAELIAQLAQQAKELGIEIDLNYSFAEPKKTDE